MAQVLYKVENKVAKVILPRVEEGEAALLAARMLEEGKLPFAKDTPYLVVVGAHPAVRAAASWISVDWATGEVTIQEPLPVMLDQATAVVGIEQLIEEVAKSRGYSSSLHISSYANSTVPLWAGEAAVFISWRDQLWLAAYSLFEEAKVGKFTPTKVEDVVARLPVIEWPEG